jgi:hypothetical protein
MVLAMDSFELGLVDMGVNLCGGDIRVAQKLLDDTQIGPSGEEVSGKTMT